MIRFGLVLFIFVFHHSSWASFKKTVHNFKKVQINIDQKASFEYINITATPAMLFIPELVTEGRKCKISDYSRSPILPGKKGTVDIVCVFRELGYHSQSFTVVVTEKGRQNSLKISYQAEAFTKIYQPKPKPTPTNATVISTTAVKRPVAMRPPVGKKSTSVQPNLDLNMSYPLNGMSVGDQDGVGICYAFATSTALEYKLKQKNINRTVSPIDVGLVFKSSYATWSPNLDSGNTYLTINQILAHGVASKECIDRVIKKETANTNMTSEKFLHMVQEIYTLRDKKKTNNEIKTQLAKLCQVYGVSNAKLDEFLNEFNRPIREYLRNLFAPCEKERDLILKENFPQYISAAPLQDATMKAKIDEILGHKSPVVISLCAEILQGELNHLGLDGERKPKLDAKGNSLCGSHAVVITGRKTENGKTSYLIRNSWGASWKEKTLTCACRTPNAYYSNCTEAPKTEKNKVMVGCWVPEASLLPNTTSVGGFK